MTSSPSGRSAPSLYPVPDPVRAQPTQSGLPPRRTRRRRAPCTRLRSRRLQLRARKIASFWSGYDLLLTPTLAMPPVPVGWEAEPEDPWEQFDRAVQFTPFTAAFNVTGQPAVSLPLHWTDDRAADRRPARRSAARRRAPLPGLLAARGGAALDAAAAAFVAETQGARQRPLQGFSRDRVRSCGS